MLLKAPTGGTRGLGGKMPGMSKEIRRIPHCSHWGAYTLLVQGQQVVGVEPFDADPHPSEIIRSVAAWGSTHRRVMQPMANPLWLQAAREGRPTTRQERQTRGQTSMVPIEWTEALSLAAREIQRVIATQGNRSRSEEHTSELQSH